MAVSDNMLNSQTWLSCQMKCSALKKVCEKLEHLVTTNEYTCHILVEWLNIVLPASKCTGSQPCFQMHSLIVPSAFQFRSPVIQKML